MKQYKVTVYYTAKVAVEVEAQNEKEAETKGIEEADGWVNTSLTVDDVKVSEQEGT